MRKKVEKAKTSSAPPSKENDLHKLESELKGVQRSLSAVVSNAPIILFVINKDGVFSLMEGQGLSVLGVKPAEFIGRSAFEIYRDHPQIPTNLRRALKGESFFSTVEVSTIVFDVRYTPVNDEKGSVSEVIGVATDVTARWRAQQERDLLLSRERVARFEAEAANRAKDEFLAVLSHELRTPMTAMIGWTWMLRSKSMDEETLSRALTIIERNMKVQAQIVEDLLDISSLRSGKLRLQSRVVDMAPILNSTINSLRPTSDAKSIQISTAFDPSPNLVLGDPERLGQIVWNLISNAIKFTPEGGEVRLRLRRAGNNIEIIVTDSGEGIEPEFIPFLFGLFRRAESHITRKHRGLGLGLAIVWDLVELHGGKVQASSEGVGKGSTFTVTLPAAERSSEEAPSLLPTPSAASKRTPRGDHLESIPMLDDVKALILDDQADSREIVFTTVKNYGAIATAASSAVEALEILHRLKPHVILCAVPMAADEGYSFIRSLRALGSEKGGDTPVIALTSFAQVEDRTRAFLAGFNLFLEKPIEPAELAAAIANLTGRNRLHDR